MYIHIVCLYIYVHTYVYIFSCVYILHIDTYVYTVYMYICTVYTHVYSVSVQGIYLYSVCLCVVHACFIACCTTVHAV